MMSRKHYVMIAAVLAAARENAACAGCKDTVDGIARDLAAELKADNGRFDVSRFLDAADCGR